MKSTILIIFFIVSVLITSNLTAKERGRDGKPPHGSFMRDCETLFELELSKDQRTVIEEKTRMYRKKMRPLRILLLEKRVDFTRMLRNPEVDEQDISDRAHDLGQLIRELQEIRLKMYLEIRRLLTPRQIERWCPPFFKPPFRKPHK